MTREPQSFEAKLFLEAADAGPRTFLDRESRARCQTAKVTVTSQAMTAPIPVIDETIDVPWEVDEFWRQVPRRRSCRR